MYCLYSVSSCWSRNSWSFTAVGRVSVQSKQRGTEEP